MTARRERPTTRDLLAEADEVGVRVFSEDEIREMSTPATLPRPEPPAAPKPIDVLPRGLPESGEELKARLGAAVRAEGAADPPPPVAKGKRLALRYLDGEERVFEFDPYHSDPVVVVEYQAPVRGEPWRHELERASISLYDLVSLTLEDVEP